VGRRRSDTLFEEVPACSKLSFGTKSFPQQHRNMYLPWHEEFADRTTSISAPQYGSLQIQISPFFKFITTSPSPNLHLKCQLSACLFPALGMAHDLRAMKQRGRTVYCFSPEAMVVTFVIELILAASVFVRHRMTRFGKTAGGTLTLLASFQFAEYRICTGTGVPSLIWARIGFIAITLLPVAGLYLVSLVSHKQHFLKIGYATAVGFVVYFVFVPKSITAATCGGNYVFFNTSNDFYRLYGVYYLGFLLLGIWEAIEKITGLQRQTSGKTVLQWLIVGYMSFMAPMGVLYLIVPETRSAIASIMCGFAIILAFILTLKVVPAYDRAHR
jgi:hypothetical protein